MILKTVKSCGGSKAQLQLLFTHRHDEAFQYERLQAKIGKSREEPYFIAVGL